MPHDSYYWNVCSKCEGKDECSPRNEENIKDCKRQGVMKYAVKRRTSDG